MRWHFIGSIIFVVLIAITAFSKTVIVRGIFALFSIMFFYIIFFLFAIEYDNLAMKNWKKKEKKIKKKLSSQQR